MISSGDTAFVLMSAALVLLMTPGLAFFYGGMVRRKNVLSVLMQCFAVACVMTVQWILFGYSVSFAPGGAFWGGLSWAGLLGVGAQPFPEYAATIPHLAFMVFQAMFAVITPALMIGAFAERMRFSAFLLFSILWATFVYDPVAHWVWGVGGWLRSMDALDFAGGTVVHINAGIAAIAVALLIGRRKSYDSRPSPPHNLPFTALGGGLLWFGWFGFNAGSALAANAVAANAFVTTHAAAAAGGIGWVAGEWLVSRTPTLFGALTGTVAGLVAITPAAGFVSPLAALVIGLCSGALCLVAVTVVKPRLGYDDSLDAFGVHGVGGMWGALATGLFASRAVNPAGADGLVSGNPALLAVQALAVLATAAYSFIATLVIYKVVDALVGMRVDEHAEIMGLDLTQHHEAGYTVLE